MLGRRNRRVLRVASDRAGTLRRRYFAGKQYVKRVAEITLSKLPEVTLGFWIIKIVATTLGETAGDTATMTMHLGYLVGTAIFAAVLAVLVAAQIATRTFRPFLYWAVIVATTTAGTTLADFLDRSLGIGYVGGASILFALLLGTLDLWYWALGSVSVYTVTTPKAEMFYWVTIMFSQTLGTALGDWVADSATADPAGLGLGYGGAALIFGGLLALIAMLYYRTAIAHVVLFWAAFILTRPLGAVVGDFLDKPHHDGGLALSRFAASATLLALIVVCILVFPQRPAVRAH